MVGSEATSSAEVNGRVKVLRVNLYSR